MNRSASLAGLIAAILALAGCTASLDDQDTAALAQLAAVAGPTSGVDADAITSTECWVPSAHPVTEGADSDTSWRVLCRVYYTDDSGERYRDTTCIGDFALTPMLDRCYRWTHYDFAPTFEDSPSVTAG